MDKCPVCQSPWCPGCPSLDEIAERAAEVRKDREAMKQVKNSTQRKNDSMYMPRVIRSHCAIPLRKPS